MTIISIGPRPAYTYEDITVAGTAIGLTAAKVRVFTDAVNRTEARSVVITCEGADVRYTLDGTTPTATKGHLFSPGQSLQVDGIVNLDKLKFIRTDTTSATLRVTYYH